MKTGDVSTTALCPHCHSHVVSPHLRDVGVNPKEHRLLVGQAVVTMEARFAWREREWRSILKPLLLSHVFIGWLAAL